MSKPKFEPDPEIKNQDTAQSKEDLTNQKVIPDHLNDQFLNEKAIDIESLAHRVFGANPAILNVKGEAYILHADGTKTPLKPEELNKIQLAEGDVIVTNPEASVIIEVADKQCVVDGNNQLLVDKALLMTAEGGSAPCPGTELLEDDGHTHTFVMNDHWQMGKVLALYGTLSGEFEGISTNGLFFGESDLSSTQDTALRGGFDEAAPIITLTDNNNDNNEVSPVTATVTPSIAQPSEPPIPNPNVAPEAVDSLFTGGEDQSNNIFALSSFGSTDANVGDTVENVRIESLPSDGTIEFFNGTAWVPVSAGTIISAQDINDGNLRYVSAPDESGDNSFAAAGEGDQFSDYDSFTFSVSDGDLFSPTSATMTIDITPIADAPSMGVGITSSAKVFSTVYLSDAGPTITNPDFPDPSTTNEQANIGGAAVAGAALYTLSFNDNGTPNDLTDDTVDLVFVSDFWSLQNPNADPAFLNQRIDGRLENPSNPLLGPIVQNPDFTGPVGDDTIAQDTELSDVGYTVAAIAAVLDGSQIFALDDARVDSASRLDFGFAEINTTGNTVTGFTNISGPDLDTYTPDGVGHATNTTIGAQGMTFFGGGGQQQIFVFNVATDQVQSFDISTSLTTGSNPFDPTHIEGTFGATGNLGFRIISSKDYTGAGPDLHGAGDDTDGDGWGDNPDGIGDNPDGIGDFIGMYYDISGGDIIFDQYDQVYMISNSRENVNALGGSDQVGGFAKLNLEDGTAELLNDFRDTFNFFADSDVNTTGIQTAHGMVGPGGLFLDAGANNGDGLFYISLAGAQRFSPDGTAANDQQISSAFIVLDRDGNIVTFQDMTLNGQPFTHSGQGDGTNSLQIEYTLPILATVSDTDGSEALTHVALSLTDSEGDNSIDGAQLRFDGSVVNAGDTVQVDAITNFGNESIDALVSFGLDGLGHQTWTLTLQPLAGHLVSSIDDQNFTITASGDQNGDFTMTVAATSTELSTGGTATGSYNLFVDRGGDPQIDAVGSIIINETAGNDAGSDDVGPTTIDSTDPGFDTVNADISAVFDQVQIDYSVGTPIEVAHVVPGDFLYLVPNSFAGSVAMTDNNGNPINGVDSGIQSLNLNNIFLYTDDSYGNGNMIVGREGSGSVADPLGALVFSLYLDEGSAQFGAANDSLWLALYQNIANPGGVDVAIQDLIYLTVKDESLTSPTTSTDSINLTFVDDPNEGNGGGGMMMMMSFFGGPSGGGEEEGGVSTEDASSSSFMTVSNDDSLNSGTVTNDDPSTINDDSSQNPDGGDALTNEMVFSSESSENPEQADQQAALDGSDSSPQQEVEQQQQEQTTDPAPSAPDPIAQSTQEADQQAQSSSGG